VIFLTIGSHEPFDRLVEAVDKWVETATGAVVFGQITERGKYRPKNFEWAAHLDVDAYRNTCLKAEFLIAHAGMGSIITAMDHAKPIVIMPRRGHLHETRNDHQFATARQFRGKPGIFVADDEAALAGEIEKARAASRLPGGQASSPFAQERLISFLSGYIRGTSRR